MQAKSQAICLKHSYRIKRQVGTTLYESHVSAAQLFTAISQCICGSNMGKATSNSIQNCSEDSVFRFTPTSVS